MHVCIVYVRACMVLVLRLFLLSCLLGIFLVGLLSCVLLLLLLVFLVGEAVRLDSANHGE